MSTTARPARWAAAGAAGDGRRQRGPFAGADRARRRRRRRSAPRRGGCSACSRRERALHRARDRVRDRERRRCRSAARRSSATRPTSSSRRLPRHEACGASPDAAHAARYGQEASARRARPRHRLRRARARARRSCWCCTSARRCSRGCRATSSTTSCSARSSGCATEVEAKLMRVPLAYFDGQPHGEVLSRVTNDIDNVAMALQQTLSQILDALLTVGRHAGHARRDLAAARADRARDGAAVGRRHREDRQARAEGLRRAVEARRRAQRSDRGGVHRPRARQGVRPPARDRGRGSTRRTTSCSRRASARSSSRASSCRRSTSSGTSTTSRSPSSAACASRRARCCSASVQAFIQYSRQFTQKLVQLASVANVLQSGVASAERVFELLDAPEQSADRRRRAAARRVRGEVAVRRRDRSATSPTCR